MDRLSHMDMKEMEFYLYDDELWCMTADGRNEQLTERNTELVKSMLEKIREFYPEAYNALGKWFQKSSKNVPYYQYLIVDQFCRCNFGRLDSTKKDVDSNGNFNFEKGYCPVYGRCPYANIVCNPRFNSKISDAEMRVMKMVYEGASKEEIAESLYLSPHTIKNHINSVYAKLGIHEKAEFIRYANSNHLF